MCGCVFFSCDIDNCCCDICNDLVVYCVGLAYNVFLSQMIDNKIDSHLKGLINPYYFCYYYYYDSLRTQCSNFKVIKLTLWKKCTVFITPYGNFQNIPSWFCQMPWPSP